MSRAHDLWMAPFTLPGNWGNWPCRFTRNAEDGTDYLDEWLLNQDTEIRNRVQTHIDRVKLGNFLRRL